MVLLPATSLQRWMCCDRTIPASGFQYPGVYARSLHEKGIVHNTSKNGEILDGSIDFVRREPFNSQTEANEYILENHSKWDGPMAVAFKIKGGKAVPTYVKNAKTKQENGFDLTDYDIRCIDYAKKYSRELLAIDVNIPIEEMLNTAWKLFGECFKKEELGIRQEFIDKYLKQ